MVIPSPELFQQLTTLVGTEQVCTVADLEAAAQDQIRQLLSTEDLPAYRVCPQTIADLKALMVAAHQIDGAY